jgi:phosphate-selective porin
LLAQSIGAPEPLFHASGYIQGRFTESPDSSDRFEVRRARLTLSGSPVEGLSYTVQVDAFKSPRLLDAALEWHPITGLHLTAGQFKIPFSLESVTPDNRVVPIERARVVNSLVPGRDQGTQARDVGFQLSGAFRRWDYTVGVFRGETLVYAPQAHYRGAAARVVVHPVRGLSLGVAEYHSFSATNHQVKTREGTEAAYDHGALGLRAEYIWGRDATLQRRGGYTLGTWRLSKRWEGMVQSDWYTTNVDKPGTTLTTWLAGGNFYVFKNVRLQANSGARNGPRGLWRGVFEAQIQAGF